MLGNRIEAIPVAPVATLPNGVRFTTTVCPDYTRFLELPSVIGVGGFRLAKTGWNSDKGVAYYRSDREIAIGLDV